MGFGFSVGKSSFGNRRAPATVEGKLIMLPLFSYL